MFYEFGAVILPTYGGPGRDLGLRGGLGFRVLGVYGFRVYGFRGFGLKLFSDCGRGNFHGVAKFRVSVASFVGLRL